MSRDAARVDSGSRDVDKRCPAESALTVSRRMCYLSAALGAGQSPILSRVFARTAVNSRGSHGTADHRIHRTRHHGPAHGEEPHQGRSEEHTSELQSRQYLVCRLLLEKKKKKKKKKNIKTTNTI